MSDIDSQARVIFFEAIDRKTPEQRCMYVDEACGDDVQLRARVDDLLRAHQDAGEFLGGAASAVATIDQPISEKLSCESCRVPSRPHS